MDRTWSTRHRPDTATHCLALSSYRSMLRDRRQILGALHMAEARFFGDCQIQGSPQPQYRLTTLHLAYISTYTVRGVTPFVSMDLSLGQNSKPGSTHRLPEPSTFTKNTGKSTCRSTGNSLSCAKPFALFAITMLTVVSCGVFDHGPRNILRPPR